MSEVIFPIERFKWIMILSFILLCAFANGQVINRNLLQKFSTEMVRQSLIPKDKFHPYPNTPIEWAKAVPDSFLRKIIKEGEQSLSYEFKPLPATLGLEYVRIGNRTHYQDVSFSKRENLLNLVLAESIEGKGRFLDKILDGIWSICEESDWGIPAHLFMQKAGNGLPDVEEPRVDLFAGETAGVLAWTDYLTGKELDSLSPLIRKRIYYEANRRVLIPISQNVYLFMGSGRTDVKLSNWDPWIMANCITTDLLLEKNEEKRAAYLSYYMKYVDLYINGLGEDGGCEEGPGYWAGAAGNVFNALNMISMATNKKVDIYQDPIIQKMASYIYKVHIADRYFVNVADAPPKFIPNGLMLYRFGKAIDDKIMTGFGSWVFHKYPDAAVKVGGQMSRIGNLMAIVECAQYPPQEALLPDAWISDVQLMASRSSDGFYVASHGGTNGESHNHNDNGDFIVYYKGMPVIIDVGSGIYSGVPHYDWWYTNSGWHNLPVINGHQQSPGIEYKATDVKDIIGEDESQLSMNLEKSYPADAGVKYWRRRVKMNKTDGVEVTDSFDINNLENLTQTFMTACDVNIAKKGKIRFTTLSGEEVTMDYDSDAWGVTKERMELKKPEEQSFKKNWDGKDIYRVLLTRNKINGNDKVIYKFHN